MSFTSLTCMFPTRPHDPGPPRVFDQIEFILQADLNHIPHHVLVLSSWLALMEAPVAGESPAPSCSIPPSLHHEEMAGAVPQHVLQVRKHAPQGCLEIRGQIIGAGIHSQGRNRYRPAPPDSRIDELLHGRKPQPKGVWPASFPAPLFSMFPGCPCRAWSR